jgi:hypothetical protein
VELAALAVWLGAGVFMAAAVAPAAFAVLPTRALAGVLVARILPPLLYSGMFVAVACSTFELVRGRTFASRTRHVMAVVIMLSCGVGQFIVDPRIDRIRSQIPGAVESLSIADPRRVEFGRLHGLSVVLLGVAMLAAVTSIVLLSKTTSADSSP